MQCILVGSKSADIYCYWIGPVQHWYGIAVSGALVRVYYSFFFSCSCSSGSYTVISQFLTQFLKVNTVRINRTEDGTLAVMWPAGYRQIIIKK